MCRSGRSLPLAGKRTLDIAASVTLLMLLAPMMLAIGVAVVATSPGGPFFTQVRAGRHGRQFSIYKFRTMNADDPATAGQPYSYERTQARVTRVGRLLRRYSLDELPQLVNIVRGDMSLVGPRPDTVRHAEEYDDFQRQRLAVRPGVTGWAQIQGRNELTWAERIALDVEYIERWSLALDLRILVQTALVVLSGRGTELPRGAR